MAVDALEVWELVILASQRSLNTQVGLVDHSRSPRPGLIADSGALYISSGVFIVGLSNRGRSEGEGMTTAGDFRVTLTSSSLSSEIRCEFLICPFLLGEVSVARLLDFCRAC